MARNARGLILRFRCRAFRLLQLNTQRTFRLMNQAPTGGGTSQRRNVSGFEMPDEPPGGQSTGPISNRIDDDLQILSQLGGRHLHVWLVSTVCAFLTASCPCAGSLLSLCLRRVTKAVSPSRCTASSSDAHLPRPSQP